MNKQSKKVKSLCDITRCIENNRGSLLHTEITKRHLNNYNLSAVWHRNKRIDPFFLLRFQYLLVLKQQHAKFHRKSRAGSFTKELP